MRSAQSTRSLVALVVATACFLVAGCAREDAPRPAADQAAAGVGVESATFYDLEGMPAEVTLADGKWEGEPFQENASSFPAAYLSKHLTATGDLDGDGIAETVAVVVTTSGGTGSFFTLTLLRQRDGALEHFASYFLGDRVRIRSLTVREGGIEMVSVEAGENDPLCCPTQRVDRRFVLEGDEIMLASEDLSGPLERAWGYLVWGHENRSFRTCDAASEGWVVDEMKRVSLASLYEEFATEPYEPVFVDVEGRWFDGPDEGFGADFEKAFEVTDVFRVEREGFGCRLDIDGLLLRGFGNEPGWRLDVRADGASLSSMTLEETVEFTGDGQLSNQQFEFRNADYVMGVTFLKIPCRDTMSGSYFSHQVEIRFGDLTFKGCGIPGR